jgi:hypothetical protein
MSMREFMNFCGPSFRLARKKLSISVDAKIRNMALNGSLQCTPGKLVRSELTQHHLNGFREEMYLMDSHPAFVG